MSGFVKRKSVNTVNPAGGVNPAQAPNVGQYGWTNFDANNVNQIIQYVNLSKEYMERTKEYADYVEGRFGELQEFMNFIEIVYKELKPIIDEIQPIYQDIIFRHEDTITRHIDIIRLHNEVTQDKILIDEIKQEAIDETQKVKQEAIDATNKIKADAIKDTTAIKAEATAEANRAKTEADRSAAEAVKSANSATASATSATKSESEAGKAAQSAKDAADIAEELRKGQVYRGTWNIEENNSFPPKPDTNSVWDITLKEDSTQFTFNGEVWYWGDRLLYLKDDDKFSQIESGSTVISVNGKGGAVTLDAKDVGALPVTGGTMSGTLTMDADLVMGVKNIKGKNNNIILRDHGNGNVTLSASTTDSGVTGDLYLGYNSSGHSTRRVLMRSPMYWSNSTHFLVNDEGRLNSEFMTGPIRTEKTDAGVYHTTVGGTDAVNRGRTLIVAGEAGKAIADNTNNEAESVHIAGDQAEGVYIHSGVQNGWGGSTHQRYTFVNGDIRSQKMDGSTVNTFYHTGNKPTPADLGAVRKEGDDNIGSLTLAADKVLNATLTHQRGYFSMYPYGTGYGLGGASGNRCRMYYKEHNNGNPSDLSRGIVVNSHDADGTSHPMDMWLGGNKVYHAGNKPTAADVGALPITGGNLTGMLRIDHGDYSHRMVLSGDMTYYQGGHETDRANQKLALSGFNGYGLTTARFIMSDGVGPTVAWGSTVHKIYHEGFKPDMGAILGDGASTTKLFEFNKPSGAENGKYYPVLFSNTDARPDVFIDTTSSGGDYSMNNCSFKGQVRSGGWSDKGAYASGDFTIYSSSERAIHSIVGATESSNHYVIYVEARAFPIRVTVDSNVNVTSTGKDTTYGTSTYRAGISGMTSSGDYGTKTSLILDLNRGNGYYNSKALYTRYISAIGGINATERVNILDYNENGAFITRRPGKTSYSMMGQDSNGNTMLGLGVDTSGFSSYFKVSAATLAYSNNGSSESRIYHEGFKPSLGELGGISSTGGTMTGALKFIDNDKFISPSGNNMHLAAKQGTVVLEGKNNPIASVNGTNYNIYHVGNKPSAGDVGALATTGGTLTGQLRIRSNSSHIDLIEADNADKTWRIEGQNNNLDFTEAGVGTRLRLAAGGGATLSGQLNVNGHVTLGQGNILKFPSPNYSAGGQIFTRDGGQYGSNMVITSGGNLIMGGGESAVSAANEIGAATTEHTYITADGDIVLNPNGNTWDDRVTHTFRSSGQVELNGTVRTGALYSFSSAAKCGLTLSANATGYGELVFNNDGTLDWNNGLRAFGGQDWRIGSNRIYHEGFRPDVSGVIDGKAIGSARALGSTVDLDDFKTPGVYFQSANAGATNGTNYPENLAGSLVVYQAAGIIQEYRVYNTSRVWSRAQYSSGAWTPWVKKYDTANKPTASDVGAMPTTGGTFTGAVGVPSGFVVAGRNSVGADANEVRVGDSPYERTLALQAKDGNVFVRSKSGEASRVYHAGYKPSAADVGAVSKTGDHISGKLTIAKSNAYWPTNTSSNSNNFVNSAITSLNAGNSGLHIFGDGTTNARRMGLQSGHSDAEYTTSYGILDLNPYGGQVRANGHNIYHAGSKPTAADVGALATTGGTTTGTTALSVTGGYGLRFTVSGDTAYVQGGKTDSSAADQKLVISGYSGKKLTKFDILTNGQGIATIDGSKIYTQGFKPTAADVGALPLTGGKMTGTFDTAFKKSAITVNDQASIRYKDAGNVWFHNYAEGGFLKWATGDDSNQTQRMTLDGAGGLAVTGGFSTGGNIVSGSGLFANGGYITAVTSATPMFELHRPGSAAAAIYLDGSGFMRFCSSNGSAGEAAWYFTAHGDGLLTPNKYTSTLQTGRAWTEVGKSAFYNDSGQNMGDGTYHGLTSMYSTYPGAYAQELSLGYFSANSDWNQGNIVLQSYNASTGGAFRWMFRNNGTLEPSHGGWRFNHDGSQTGSIYGGGYLHEWVQRNFAPASDANLKTILGESKVSALDQVAKMKFHEYVWDDSGFAKDSVKVNRLGVIAQEMEAIDANYTRDIVTHEEGGEKSIKALDTANLLAVALKAIQELQAEVADLKEKLNVNVQ